MWSVNAVEIESWECENDIKPKKNTEIRFVNELGPDMQPNTNNIKPMGLGTLLYRSSSALQGLHLQHAPNIISIT